MSSVKSNNLRLKLQRFTPPRCIDRGVRKFSLRHKLILIIFKKAYPLIPGVRSLCLRFLNQFETWVRVNPVFLES